MFDYFREQFDTKGADTKIVTFFIGSSTNFETLSRSYIKITDVAANVGGILSIFIVVGDVISKFFSNILMKTKILNTLYYFDIEKDESESGNTIVNNINAESIQTHIIESPKNKPLNSLQRTKTVSDIHRESNLLLEIKNVIENTANSGKIN